MAPAQDCQRFALQRVASPDNLYIIWIAVEVMMVGSVSSIRSTASITMC
jgi:hypothetical protein